MFAGSGFTGPILPSQLALTDGGIQLINENDTTKALIWNLAEEPTLTTQTIRPPYIIVGFWQGGSFNLPEATAKVTITTDVQLVLDRPGTYLLSAYARLDLAGWVSDDEQPLTLKLRRTNNTAADLLVETGSSLYAIASAVAPIRAAASTDTIATLTIRSLYSTAASDDNIQLWGTCEAASGAGAAGTVDVKEVQFIAHRIG